MYKIECYIPLTHIDSVKEAIFTAGAGEVGGYQKCCWQVIGKGQFEPQKGSQPFIGNHDVVEVVEECKIEIVCLEETLKAVIKALKDAHPYETPAYFITKGINL
ncbi:MAG: NGG1p interacting factor NIF3 [Gammaproteobacteria bacterium]|nr:NGG1p interacting factor NIF3 [Gammaproteobacteria bacterium]